MKKLMIVFFFASIMMSCDKDDDGPSIKKIEISAAGIGYDELKVQWPEVEGAIYYEVAITPGSDDDVYIVENGTSFTYTDLLADTDYEITVKAGTSFTDEHIIGEGKQSLKTLALPVAFLGTWKYQYNDNSLIYTFNANGTGTYTYNSEMPIRWKADATTITITKFYGSGTSQTNTYDYSFEDVDLLKMDGTYYYLQE